MPLWALNIVGWLFVKRYWILYGVLAVLVLFVLFIFKACSKPAPKLNQQEIMAAQSAIAANDRQKQIEVLANSDVRELRIDSNVAAGRKETINAIANSKATWANATNEQLAEELERRANK